MPRLCGKVGNGVHDNVLQVAARETGRLCREGDKIDFSLERNLVRKDGFKDAATALFVGKRNLDMDRNPPDERAIKVAGEVRRKGNDAVKGIELLEHDGPRDVDGLVGGLRDGRHPLSEDAVGLVEEE